MPAPTKQPICLGCDQPSAVLVRVEIIPYAPNIHIHSESMHLCLDCLADPGPLFGWDCPTGNRFKSSGNKEKN